jgi:hypothetical protein
MNPKAYHLQNKMEEVQQLSVTIWLECTVHGVIAHYEAETLVKEFSNLATLLETVDMDLELWKNLAHQAFFLDDVYLFFEKKYKTYPEDSTLFIQFKKAYNKMADIMTTFITEYQPNA